MACYDLQLEKMTQKQIKFSWRCPKCHKRNNWEWDKHDIIPGPVTMHCDRCFRRTAMYQDGVGNVCCIENIDQMLTLDVAKAFLSKLGYEIKTKRKNDRKSLLD